MVGALIIISSSSLSPFCTESIASITSFARSSVSISSMKCENNLIFDGNLSIKYPNESRSKLKGYLNTMFDTSYLLYLGKAVAIVPSLSMYISIPLINLILIHIYVIFIIIDKLFEKVLYRFSYLIIDIVYCII